MLPVTLIPVGMMPTNCYLLEKEGLAVIIDPGASGKAIAELCRQRNLQLQAILLTHGHFDHIGGVEELHAAFPEAGIYISAADAPCLYSQERSLGGGYPGFTQPNIREVITPADGDLLTFGKLSFRVMETPGHTPGSLVYICGNAIFAGDTLFAGGCGRVDLPGGNAGQMRASLQKLAQLKGDYAVYPGHEEATTLEKERQNNYAMRGLFDFLS